MKRFFLILLALAASMQLLAQAEKNLVENNNTFAFDLLRNTYSKSENTFFSPFSISTALAMMYAGAKGETKNQMSEVLHFNSNQEVFHQNYESLISSLKLSESDSAINFLTANALWKKEPFPFHGDFLDLCKKNYKTPIYKLTKALAINTWCDTNTNGKIKKIVTDNDLVNSIMVLTNSVYFKGDWFSEFDSSKTKKEIFNGIEAYNVDMMYQLANVDYFENDQLQMINLPYQGGNISMNILLPKTGYSLSDLVNDLDPNKLSQYRNTSFKSNVEIYLPKFKIQSSFKLNEPLKEMGMSDAFNIGKADFTGISPTSGLYISKVLHKAYVEVNEQGTEATAVTAVIGAVSVKKEIIFKANRPFLFYITDKETESILFLGSIQKPMKDE